MFTCMKKADQVNPYSLTPKYSTIRLSKEPDCIRNQKLLKLVLPSEVCKQHLQALSLSAA